MTLSIVEAIPEEGAPPGAWLIDTYSYFLVPCRSKELSAY